MQCWSAASVPWHAESMLEAPESLKTCWKMSREVVMVLGGRWLGVLLFDERWHLLWDWLGEASASLIGDDILPVAMPWSISARSLLYMTGLVRI